ncbi:hypothetical protein [Streptomyces sp. NPDC002588]|uniref:hypothetical protein n=1 Tax=Streptomyces sp. NPDC002588 TaxID=3154419 RepID=UPI00332F0BD4
MNAGPDGRPAGRTGRRIWIVGAPGAGKSTLAKSLSLTLGLPHRELDALFWQSGWRRADDEAFREAVSGLAAEDAWIIDGQYEDVHPLLGQVADVVIWLDPPRAVALRRTALRALRRLLGREELWNGNREHPRSAWNLLVWAWRTRDDVESANLRLLGRLAARGAWGLRARSSQEAHSLLVAQWA